MGTKKWLLFLAMGLVSYNTLKAQEVTQQISVLPKVRLALNAGYSRRLAKTANDVPAEFKNYVNEIKNGYHLGADVAYIFSKSWSVGLKYNLFQASNGIANVTVTDINGNTRNGSLSDDIAINFIGPSTSSQYISKSGKHLFLFAVALGYMSYDNNAIVVDPIKISGGTFGAGLDIAYDLQIVKKLYFGIQASLLTGTLSRLTYSSGTMSREMQLSDQQKESLTRLDLSAGLRLHL